MGQKMLSNFGELCKNKISASQYRPICDSLPVIVTPWTSLTIIVCTRCTWKCNYYQLFTSQLHNQELYHSDVIVLNAAKIYVHTEKGYTAFDGHRLYRARFLNKALFKSHI